MIDISCESDDFYEALDSKNLGILAQKILTELKYGDYDISLFFCTPETIRDLNKNYRKADYVTDVLSFSQLEGDEKIETSFLGDIAICLEKAKTQAKEMGHSLESELNFLVLHGILHLIGYDHEKDDGEMEKIQKEIFYKLTGEDIE
ncbi:MAG TPA: rRNA maturation RNase YbeY [Spirochaetota bacterium]|nr:rRNA maturation RNase YbeY [Spirochaetota bacterium]